jgi:hypothetical protein
MRPFRLSVPAAGLAVLLALTPQARAALIIKVDGMTVSSPTNDIASFVGGVGTFNINAITMTGVDSFAGNGTLVDNGSLDISSSGKGTLTILLTETDLTAGSFGAFSGDFSGTITNATATRSFYVDPTNSGLLTDLLGSTTAADETFTKGLDLSGPFSLTEEIIVTANGKGATLSSDDDVKVPAPEPCSLALLGLGMAAMGATRGRRRT